MVLKAIMVFFIKMKFIVKVNDNHSDQNDNHQERILKKKEKLEWNK
jgi:hypothetical protein